MPQAVTLSVPTVGAEPIGGWHLNLGAGKSDRQPGLLNCDLYPGDNIDVAFDLTQMWPFPSNSVASIYLSHVLEHLLDPKAFFREAHRCLQPNGSLLIRVPYGGHRAAWWDLEHVRPWFAESFAMLQPGYAESVGNPQHDAWAWPFSVSVQLRVSYRLARWLRHWYWRWAFCRMPTFFDSEIEELWAQCYALKTEDAVARYQQNHTPNVVGMTYTAWNHHLNDTPPTKAPRLVDLSQGHGIIGYLWRVTGMEKA